MKIIKYKKLYDGAVIELTFVTQPKRGFFKEHIQPAVDALKGFIPVAQREYDPNTYKWQFNAQYWEALSLVFEGMGFKLNEQIDKDNNDEQFKRIEVDTEYAENFYRSNTSTATSVDTGSVAKHLSAYLGVTVTNQKISELKKLYRRKALELHPDRNNGDGAKMSELNMLWTLYTSQERVQ